jgi:hypothetical protein
MCQKQLWDQAVESGDAYFPPAQLRFGDLCTMKGISKQILLGWCFFLFHCLAIIST